MTAPRATDLLREVGLLADGPVVLGRPVRAPGPGVYLVELATPLPAAPIELTRIGKWIERVPSLRLDGERPTSKALAARLGAFWLNGQTVLFVGSAETSIAGRVAALERHILGDRRPHASAHWLKTLRVDGLRVWWARTDALEEYEDALLGAFGAGVSEAERATLHDPSLVLPFANLRAATGERKGHGISGSVLPEDREPATPPTHVVELPDADADGARLPERGAGTIRRAPRDGSAPRPAPRPSRSPASAANRPVAEPVQLSAEGIERMRAELDELTRVRRPEVIARIRTAKELGDLRENADYTAAREEQSFLEGRIQALEGRLRSAVVAEVETSGRIGIGSRVEVETDGEPVTLTIVGSAESDPSAGRISAASPVGRALLGQHAGDDVVVRTPRGEARYRVLRVE